MRTVRTITPELARRLFVTRQRLAGPRPDPTPDGLVELVCDLGCLQLDPTSAVAPNHVLVPWSRVGPYDRRALAMLRWEERRLFEYWAHAASLVLTEDFPIHGAAMRRWGRDDSLGARRVRAFMADNRALHRHILGSLRTRGPLAAGEMGARPVVGPVPEGWPHEQPVDRMLQFLWRKGVIMVAARRGQRRLWDLAERVLPAWTPRQRGSEREVVRAAAERSLRALGVARPRDIDEHFTRRDYPRLPDVLAGLRRAGRILPVRVEGDGVVWPGTWFVHAEDLPLLDRLDAGWWEPRTTLLSPFDNLICDRARAELMFAFRYRIEIYTPKSKREFGYFVMPVLHGDRLIARIDPLMDRRLGRLTVNAIHPEPGAPVSAEVRTATAGAVRDLAAFLGAGDIVAAPDVPMPWRRAVGG